MIAKQSVYLNADRSQALPEGHDDAKFLLVREGNEIEEAIIEKYDAMSLVNSAAKAKPAAPAPSPREAFPGDAKPAPAKGKKGRKR